MLLCLLFAPALHTRMKRRRSVPESINRRFSFRLLNTVTRPTHLGESAKKAKTFIGRVSLLPSREKRKKEREKIAAQTPISSRFPTGFPFSSNGKKRKNYYLSPITSRLYDYPPPPPLHLLHCQLQRQRELSATRRTEEPEAKNPPSVFLSRCNKLLPPVAAYHRASSILIKSALRKPSFPEGSQFC